MPKSRVKAPICDVTISPVVDIIVIMANISQKIGVRSISAGADVWTGLREPCVRRLCEPPCAAATPGPAGAGPARPREPTTPKTTPKRVSASLIASIAQHAGDRKVVSSAPMP